MNSNDVIICIIVTLINIAILACFTVLAIFFEKWWIIFLAIIFWTSVSVKNKKDNKGEK